MTDIRITNPDEGFMGVSPAYDGTAADAHTVLLPGCYTTTDGGRLLVQDNWSQIIGSHTLSLNTGVYFLIDPTNPDNSFRNLGVLPGETRWDEWSEIEPEGVRDDEEPVLAAIALAVRTGTPKDMAAARSSAAKYDVTQLPTDDRGLPYKGEGRGAYYVSLCHGAAFTISDSLLCCKVCFEEADDERQGFLPTVADAFGN